MLHCKFITFSNPFELNSNVFFWHWLHCSTDSTIIFYHLESISSTLRKKHGQPNSKPMQVDRFIVVVEQNVKLQMLICQCFRQNQCGSWLHRILCNKLREKWLLRWLYRFDMHIEWIIIGTVLLRLPLRANSYLLHNKWQWTPVSK